MGHLCSACAWHRAYSNVSYYSYNYHHVIALCVSPLTWKFIYMQKNKCACSLSGSGLKLHHQACWRKTVKETRARIVGDENDRVGCVSHLTLQSFLQAWKWSALWGLATLSASGQCPTPAHFVASLSEKKF